MRLTVSVIIVLCIFSSCRDRVVCPAYQSTYILDDSVRQTYYSYLWKLDKEERQNFLAREAAKDSVPEAISYTPPSEYFAYVEPLIPPVEVVKKNKFGIIKYKPFWLKNASLRTAPKENVHKPIFKEEVFDKEGEFLAADFALLDSLGNSQDSSAVDIPLALKNDSIENAAPKFLYGYKVDDNFNMEQVYYNKYFRKLFIDNRPKPKLDSLAALKLAVDSVSTDTKKGIGGFFKGLFKKKDKKKKNPIEDDEELDEEAIPEEEEELEEEESDQ